MQSKACGARGCRQLGSSSSQGATPQQPAEIAGHIHLLDNLKRGRQAGAACCIRATMPRMLAGRCPAAAQVRKIRRARRLGQPRTSAVPASRFTDASCTPVTPRSAASTALLQLLHVMPPTRSSCWHDSAGPTTAGGCAGTHSCQYTSSFHGRQAASREHEATFQAGSRRCHCRHPGPCASRWPVGKLPQHMLAIRPACLMPRIRSLPQPPPAGALWAGCCCRRPPLCQHCTAPRPAVLPG